MTAALFRMTSRSSSFGGTLLGLRFAETGGAAAIDHLDATSISVLLPWPAWLCRDDGQLCLSAALAIADETSTFGMASWDKQLRPGVSVSLSGERTTSSSSSAAIEAGETITFASRLSKGGASLAWIDLEVLRGDELLITGRHLKFQPSGLPPGWSIISHPLCRPALYKAMEIAEQKGLTPFGERLPSSDEAIAALPPLPPAGTLRMDVLGMAEQSSSSTEVAESSSPSSSSSFSTTFEVGLTRQHGNPGASLHGGCASMLLEEAASAGYRAASGASAAPAVQRMHVNLLGAIPVPGLGKPPKPILVSSNVNVADRRAHAVLQRAPPPSAHAAPAVEADVWW